MDFELRGKRALVSGSTAGIGFAIAQALAAEGASVIVNGRTEERTAQAVAALRAGGQTGLPEADVRRVVRLIRINEYKRRQAPIGIRITHRGFGRDWRYPITSGYRSR